MTRTQVVTETPTPLVGVASGQRYFLQNSRGPLSPGSPLYVAIKNTDAGAVAGADGFVLLRGAGETLSLAAGEAAYVWREDGAADFLCAYEEVA